MVEVEDGGGRGGDLTLTGGILPRPTHCPHTHPHLCPPHPRWTACAPHPGPTPPPCPPPHLPPTVVPLLDLLGHMHSITWTWVCFCSGFHLVLCRLDAIVPLFLFIGSAVVYLLLFPQTLDHLCCFICAFIFVPTWCSYAGWDLSPCCSLPSPHYPHLPHRVPDGCNWILRPCEPPLPPRTPPPPDVHAPPHPHTRTPAPTAPRSPPPPMPFW